MGTLLPQVLPLTPDEFRRAQTLTIFDISAEFLAFIIADDRLVGRYTSHIENDSEDSWSSSSIPSEINCKQAHLPVRLLNSLSVGSFSRGQDKS